MKATRCLSTRMIDICQVIDLFLVYDGDCDANVEYLRSNAQKDSHRFTRIAPFKFASMNEQF